MSPQPHGVGAMVPSPAPAAQSPLTAPPQPPAIRPTRRGWLAGSRLIAPLAAFSPFAGATWFVLRFNPTDRTVDPTGPCLWHAATGINGPSCGGTRMFYYLIHGNLV